MPYTADKPGSTPDTDALRARIPGWGADLDPADRPAFPREQPDIVTGAHWELPEQQPGGEGRERSIEHERLTPVFGTAQPLHGVSGAVRRFAYDRFSEGQTAHWLLLVLGDRVDAVGSHAASLFSRRPDDPLTQSGVTGEVAHHPLASRVGRGRIDLKHAWLDPILVVGPWVLASVVVVKLARAAFLPAAKRRTHG
ncbi:hypothetical protein H9651_01105 [Microbacterium sp. Sa4CUA7]|uniref:Uncharacterized protein n=1 Tax=Microbacterium pullorum TaxID=2762236 RepID=A0ABR8RZF9_9MICO|nr:hypothetical protein [Microbacterium pullorum]MBD7956234.1 hypothetical protein [Microbacterium pullorum]